MGSQKQNKKRTLSVFDVIQELESEDVRTESRQRKKTTAQAHRAQAAQSQNKIYNHLVECRILLQRAVVATESLPEDDSSSVVDSCNDLLETLLQARQQVMTGATVDDSNDNEYSGMVRNELSSKELHETLQQEYETCREEWKKVLNRRHNDLKLHAGLTAKSQFRVVDSSFWQQVDATIEYEQLRRQSKDMDNTEDCLDDSKVYQQLLKDFVAHSTSTASGSGFGRLQAGKSAQNKKREVDRRASKGRKIRYKEIPKLVNFTFPLSRPNSSNLDQDEWFQSLFGGAAKM